MEEKQYRLKYKDKWMNVTRMLGTYIYELCDNPNEIELIKYNKAMALKSLVGEDCNLNTNEIEIVKFE